MANEFPMRRGRESRQVEVDPPILGFTCIEFSVHADKQMAIRGFTDEDVYAVLRNPDRTDIEAHNEGVERWRRHRTFRKSTDVVFKRYPEALLIITVIEIERRISGRGKR